MSDFRKVLETFRPSGQHSQEYRQEQANTGQASVEVPCSLSSKNLYNAFASCAAPVLLHTGAASA
jgi:hypothetical protein